MTGKLSAHAKLNFPCLTAKPAAHPATVLSCLPGRKVDPLAHHVLPEQALLLLQHLADALLVRLVCGRAVHQRTHKVLEAQPQVDVAADVECAAGAAVCRLSLLLYGCQLQADVEDLGEGDVLCVLVPASASRSSK